MFAYRVFFVVFDNFYQENQWKNFDISIKIFNFAKKMTYIIYDYK